MNPLEHLFSPFSIKGVSIRNRILSTGHDTDLGRHGLPSEELIAYQRARAKGGAGLIIVQVVAVHESARYTPEVLMGTQDESIPHFRRLFDAIHAEGAAAFVQLFHPGRELLWRKGGLVQTPLAPSVAPTERFRLVPRELTRATDRGNRRWLRRRGAASGGGGRRRGGGRGEPRLPARAVPESQGQYDARMNTAARSRIGCVFFGKLRRRSGRRRRPRSSQV